MLHELLHNRSTKAGDDFKVDIGVRGFERDYFYRLMNTFKLKVVIGQKIFPIL
jgi:hypothetical protein